MLRATQSGHIICALPAASDAKTADVLVYTADDVLKGTNEPKRFRIPISIDDAVSRCRVKPARITQASQEQDKEESDDESETQGEQKSASGSGRRRVYDASPLTVRGADMDASASYLVVATEGNLILGYDVSSQELISFGVMHRRPTGLVFTPTQKHFLVSDRLGDIYGFSVKKLLAGEITADNSSYSVEFRSYFSDNLVLGHGAIVTSMEFFKYDGKDYLVTSDIENKLRVSNFPSLFDIKSFCQGHNAPISLTGFLQSSSETDCNKLYSTSGVPPPKSAMSAGEAVDTTEFEASGGPSAIQVYLWNHINGVSLSKTTIQAHNFMPPKQGLRTSSAMTFPLASSSNIQGGASCVVLAPGSVVTSTNAVRDAILHRAEQSKQQDAKNEPHFSPSIGCTFEIKSLSALRGSSSAVQEALEEYSVAQAKGAVSALDGKQSHSLLTLYLPRLRDVMCLNINASNEVEAKYATFSDVTALTEEDKESVVATLSTIPSNGKFVTCALLTTGTLLLIEVNADDVSKSIVIARITNSYGSEPVPELSDSLSITSETYLRTIANHAKHEDILDKRRQNLTRNVKHVKPNVEAKDDE